MVYHRAGEIGQPLSVEGNECMAKIFLEKYMFELKDVIILILALYGAVLSTINAIRDARRGRRKIQIFLDYHAFETRYILLVVNVGYRPVTLSECGIRLFDQKGKPVEQLPLHVIMGTDEKFPFSLTDGTQKSFDIPNSLDDPQVIKENKWKVEAFTRDAEGNIYTTNKIRTYSSRIKSYV